MYISFRFVSFLKLLFVFRYVVFRFCSFLFLVVPCCSLLLLVIAFTLSGVVVPVSSMTAGAISPLVGVAPFVDCGRELDPTPVTKVATTHRQAAIDRRESRREAVAHVVGADRFLSIFSSM